MRKITLLLAVFALAALPSSADAAKKKAAQPAPQAQPEDTNANGARFVRDAFPVFLPSWAIPIYLSTQTEGPHAPQAAKAAKAKDAKAKRTRQARKQ